MERLELTHLLDSQAFTTGPRRSVALRGFVIRPGENYVAMRNRMSVVIAAVANTTVLLGGGNDNKLWASYSKSREARQNGDLCAWIRRTVRSVDSQQEGAFEPEYANGTSWLHGVRVSSATLPPEESRLGGLHRVEGREPRPWIDVKRIAELLKVSAERVEKGLADTKR